MERTGDSTQQPWVQMTEKAGKLSFRGEFEDLSHTHIDFWSKGWCGLLGEAYSLMDTHVTIFAEIDGEVKEVAVRVDQLARVLKVDESQILDRKKYGRVNLLFKMSAAQEEQLLQQHKAEAGGALDDKKFSSKPIQDQAKAIVEAYTDYHNTTVGRNPISFTSFRVSDVGQKCEVKTTEIKAPPKELKAKKSELLTQTVAALIPKATGFWIFNGLVDSLVYEPARKALILACSTLSDSDAVKLLQGRDENIGRKYQENLTQLRKDAGSEILGHTDGASFKRAFDEGKYGECQEILDKHEIRMLGLILIEKRCGTGEVLEKARREGKIENSDLKEGIFTDGFNNEEIDMIKQMISPHHGKRPDANEVNSAFKGKT